MPESVDWRPYEGSAESTVVGDLRVSTPVGADHLDLERELLVWLPPSYAGSDRRYPVVYAQDGRNCFDEATSNDGEWRVDETMTRLAEAGLEAVVVGVPNAGDRRASEYAPFLDRSSIPPERAADFADQEPLGDAYADFLVDRVRPLVESRFRVATDPDRVGLLGSSLGALGSLYTYFRDPGRFGFVGAMSPAVATPWQEIHEFLRERGHAGGRVYVDVGDDEFPGNPEGTARFHDGAHDLVGTLTDLGYERGADLRFVVEAGGTHHEDAWARRLPGAMRFLLADGGTGE